MPKHRGNPAIEPLPKRGEVPTEPVPHGGARPITTGSEHTLSCFGCGGWPCTCPGTTTPAS